ncbi:hypothetical protein Tcan_09439 [Toxocara canis]|uniref:G protein-coupled receptor n=1 Tax=Toxocara canis TaxID=6265 RepID=A0A0B2VXF7_TOXCA|nr:hypothetical protein Tcan_09439 [Toxocara canis]
MTAISVILTVNTHLTSVLCIVPNSLVIYFILTTSHTEIYAFRWILAVQSVLEVLTCVNLSLLDLGVLQYTKAVYFVEKGIWSLLRGSSPLIGWMLMTFLFVNNNFFVLFLFTFRYAYICNNYFLKRLFTIPGAFLVIGVVVMISVATGVASAFNATVDHYPEFDDIFEQNDLTVMTFNKHPTGVGIAIAMVLGGIIVGTYCVVFFTSTRIVRITKAAAVSEKTRRIQRQLTTVMLLQALLPFFFVTLPLALLFIFAVTPINLGEYASIVSVLFNWEPCAHPFIALYFVQPFRKRISRFLSVATLRHLVCGNGFGSGVTTVKPAPWTLSSIS